MKEPVAALTLPPVSPHRSLLWRFSLLFVLVISSSGLLQLYFSTLGWRQLVDQIEQELNWNLAADIAVKIQPEILANNPFNPLVTKILFFHLTVANPKLEFVLLDSQGNIVAAIPYAEKLVRTKVDLEPIKLALGLENPALPLYGDDPFSDSGKKVFSVAEIEFNNSSGYLYIPLLSTSYNFLARRSGEFYLASSIITGIVIASVFALTVGALLFYFLSRRFRHLIVSIEDFRKGNLDKRIDTEVEDEIGRIGLAFNQMAETIQENTIQLEEKDRIRRSLVANISHDLRGPVTSIIAHIQFMLDHELDHQKLQKHLETILDNAQSQAALIEDLFDLAALEAKTEKLDCDYCSIEHIVRAVIGELEATAQRKQITLECIADESRQIVYADSKLLRRVLQNLISNSIRYTQPGGRVTARLIHGAGGTTVCIEDTGIGIPQDELPRVFDEFYRANRHRPEDPGGTGLGLAIVKKILDLHQSPIRIESEVNKGTRISFTISSTERE